MSVGEQLEPGTRLGPYEVVSPIGKGGMGEVYRARDTKLGRDVAVKVLPKAFAQDQERVARFRREAQVLASFNHPNIASIHGFEETEAGVAIALELVEGEDLQQRLRRGPIPIDEARVIAKQIAEGLEAAHEKGIMHRDLKPANIKVTPEGQVKVLDFGLAKAFDTEAGTTSGGEELSHSPTMSWKATEAGIILGTAAYMSPEQARGKTVDKRADIWSFGVVMFEMLSGRRLFQGETASDTLAAVLRQDIDWNLLPKDLPAADRKLIERCLERDPKKRLRDIGEARIDLDLPRTAAIPIASSKGVSRRAWIGIAAAGATGFAAGLGLGVRSRGPVADVSKGTSLSITPITGSGNVIQAAISPDGRYVAYVESEQGLQSLWLVQLAGGQTLRLTPDAVVGFWGHTFTPDGNAIIYGQKSGADTDGGLYSISTLGGTPKRLLTDLDSQVTFSPDGRRFAYNRLRHPSPEETALMVANADGTDAKALATFNLPDMVAGIFFGAPTWSPDGSVIATSVFRRASVQGGDTKGWLVGVRVATGEVFTICDPGWFLAAQSAWLPDGRSLLVIARKVDQPVTQIWSVAYPGGATRQVTSDLNDHRILSLTRDGNTLLSITGDVSSSIFMESRRTPGKPRRISRSGFDGLNGVAFTGPREIAYASSVGPTMSLWKVGVDGSNRLPVTTLSPNEDVHSIASAADGTIYFLVRRPSGVEIHAVAKDGASPRTLLTDVRYGRFAILADGGQLFTRTVEGAPRIFHAAPGGGEARAVLNRVAFCPAPDPSGKRVAYYFFDEKNQFRIGVCEIDSGRLLHDVVAEPTTSNSRLLLRDEGVYLNTVTGDRANVWLQPLDGKPARKITNYDDQLLFDFDLAADGDALVVVRGPRVRNAQTITGF